MTRNWDIIRKLLTRLESLPNTDASLRLADFPDEQAYEYSYHAELLIEAGLVVGQMSRTIGTGPTEFILRRLTWEGHEFVDAVQSDTVWEETKETFAAKGLAMTFDLVKSIATEISVAWLRSATGV